MSPWDAPSAVGAAIRATGPIGCPARQTLVAGLALRLAAQGHVTEVRFNVAPGTPLEAIRLALAEVTAEDDARRRAYAGAGDEQDDLGSAIRDGAAHASRKRTGALAKRTGACLVCGAIFTVNLRHAGKHRFCSAVCRSRHRRRSTAHRSGPTEMNQIN